MVHAQYDTQSAKLKLLQTDGIDIEVELHRDKIHEILQTRDKKENIIIIINHFDSVEIQLKGTFLDKSLTANTRALIIISAVFYMWNGAARRMKVVKFERNRINRSNVT